MKKIDLTDKLAAMDGQGVYVFTRADIAAFFPDESPRALDKCLRQMVADKLLIRATRGIYVNPHAGSKKGWVIEDIAKALRPGCLSYVSLESMLSEFGVISQIPISLITVMTTGARGIFKTPWGNIEFTHTERSAASIMERTLEDPRRPLRIARKEAAVADLMRVGRNINMIDPDELDGACVRY